MPEKIQKRDGRLETWSVDRIARAIFKSLSASGIRDPLLANRLAASVEAHLKEVSIPEQEDVQDMVEQVLMEARLYSVARKYILYREKRRGIRSQDQAFLDVRDTIDTYVKNGETTGKNRARPHSFRGLSRHLSGSVQKRYALEQYPEEIRMAHENGYLHIHDLSFGMAGYCADWDLRALLREGFGFKGVTAYGPADHLDTALGQMISFLGAMQGEWAGAQSFCHVDTILAPFVRRDGLDYTQALRLMGNFIFALNSFSRGSERIPICSLGLDGTMPAWLEQDRVGVPEESPGRTYGEFIPEAEMLNKAVCEVIARGDYLNQPFGSPVLCYDLDPDFSWNSELGERIVRLAGRGRCPYLRMRNAEKKKSYKEEASSAPVGGLQHGSDELAGAIGVVSLNLPKLAYLAGRESDFLDLIGEYAEYAKQALEFKRKFIVDYMDSGMFPYSSHYLKNGLQDHYSMLSLVGGHEACMNLLGTGIATREGTALMLKVLDRLRAISTQFSRETNSPHTVTTLVNNTACRRLAGIDEELYAEIAFSNNGSPHYTNGVNLPHGHGLSLDAEIKHQAKLATRFPGCSALDIDLCGRAAATDLPLIFEKVSKYPDICLMRVHEQVAQERLS
ncbi:anaerobic ribonucleoside-triphosphate reductase [Desulfoplanes sp. PS50]